MCRPGVSRLHMFPSRLMSSPGPAARPRQCSSTLCKLELPFFSVSPMPPTGPYHWINPPPASASVDGPKAKKKDHVHRRGCHPLPSRTPPETGAVAARGVYSPVTGSLGWGVEGLRPVSTCPAGPRCCCPRSPANVSLP